MVVLDASIVLAWAFPDEQFGQSDRLLEQLQVETAIVPGHWILEVTNGLLIAARRGRLAPNEDLEILQRIAELSVQTDNETAQRGWRDIPLLAQELSLSTYDAAYLELALRRQAPLATLDQRLAAAASEVGVEVWS